ncbi:CYTH domain-containing protein [Candidatus Saccharibacteria bacterium]|nr:CYTH domain-containing protein [Candidatus Saccharibacteria bacterium]
MKRSIVKVKLNSRIDFVTTLSEINLKFGEQFWQHDRIFVPKNYDRDKSQPRLSLRTIVKNPEKDATYALVLRRHHGREQFDVVNSTVVKDYTETAHILYQLGYELKYEVSRHRQELNMGESVKISIDKIDNLPGYYAKIESELTDADDPKVVYNDLVETFRVLKVKSKPIDMTYGELVESSKHDTPAS